MKAAGPLQTSMDERVVHELLRLGRGDVVVSAKNDAGANLARFQILCAQLRIREALALWGDGKETPIEAVRH